MDAFIVTIRHALMFFVVLSFQFDLPKADVAILFIRLRGRSLSQFLYRRIVCFFLAMLSLYSRARL